MRETKDQKIERLLKKVKGLEEENKELKSNLRKSNKMNDKQSSILNKQSDDLIRKKDEIKSDKEALIKKIESQNKTISQLEREKEWFTSNFKNIILQLSFGAVCYNGVFKFFFYFKHF